MTVMPTNTRELDINTICMRAAQRAGIMSLDQGPTGAQWLNRAAFGRDMLETILDALQLEGVILRDVELLDVTLTAGIASYTLATDTIDAYGQAMYKASATDVQFQLEQIDRESYQAISDKTTQSIPSRFWVEKTGTVKVYLYPVPSVTGSILTIQRKKLLADNSDGNATPDLERYWTAYLMDALTYEFSIGMPLPERSLLRAKAKESKEIAQNGGKSSVPYSIELNHPTGWNR